MRILLKLVIVVALLGVAALSTVYAADPSLIPIEMDLVWIIIGAAAAVAVVSTILLITTRRSAERARETMIMSPLPYGHEPAFAAATPPAQPMRSLGALPERPPVPPAQVPMPPQLPPQARIPTKPYLTPAPLVDDGPTTSDPRAQQAAEEHYAQHRRRLARGSEIDIEGVTERGVSPAIRANTLQAKPQRAPIVAMRSRK
jgi:hypothetical protein